MRFVRLALGAMILAFQFQATTAESRAAEYAVWSISPMLKVRPTDSLLPGESGPIRLWAARGEAESAQVALRADEPLARVEALVSPLKGPKGRKLQPSLSLVGYVPVVTPTPGGSGEPGEYPDPLLPLAPFAVPQGEVRSLWLTVRVPADALPGVYHGAITVRPEPGLATEIPVQVTVTKVILPVQSSLQSYALIWNQGGSAHAYGEAWNGKRLRSFEEQVLEYRLTSPPQLPWDSIYAQGSDGVWQAQWTGFDRAVEDWLERGATFFRIGAVMPWFGSPVDPAVAADDSTRADWAARLRLLDRHLAERGWSRYFGLYLFDEPVISRDYPAPGDTIGPENVRRIQSMARFVHEHAPDLRLMFVTCDPAYEAVALDFPVYQWVEHINHYHADFQQQRRALGEPGWFYVCLTTKYVPAFPDVWRIERPGASHRAVGWWAFRYGCDGFLYWCVDYWEKQDVFRNPDLFGGTSGDGFLFYPNPDHQGPVLPSIRVELTRDGIEDHDLLVLLRRAMQERAGEMSPGWRERADRLLDLGSVIAAPDSVSLDPAVYEARHREALLLLEELDRRAKK